MQEYDNTDIQIHWLSQVIAKMNRTFVPEQADESHTNLYFDPIVKRLFGRWIDSPDGKIILAFNLGSLSFEWLDTRQKILHAISVLDKNMEELEKYVIAYPEKLGMKTDIFSSPLHFKIPEYGIVSLKKEDVSDPGVNSWTFFRYLANRACQDMLGYIQAESEIRIWPHHFDTGVYTMATENLGMGFGLAMKDEMIGQAYFYLSGYNRDSAVSYKKTDPLTKGRWETGEQWNGAVLPMGELTTSSTVEAGRIIQVFIKEAINWFFKS